MESRPRDGTVCIFRIGAARGATVAALLRTCRVLVLLRAVHPVLHEVFGQTSEN